MRFPTRISFNVSDVKNLKYVKKFRNFTSSSLFLSIVAKVIASIVIWAGVLIPTWGYLLIRWAAGPDGFWQEIAVLLICMVVMGWLQVLLAMGGFMLTLALILDDTI